MKMRRLERGEIETYWTIDRREVLHNIYVAKDGEMVLTPYYYEAQGWPPDHEHQMEHVYECFDRGGACFGMFDGAKLVGGAVTDSILRGDDRDRIQLFFLHVSRDYRGQGVGARLFEKARTEARERGARWMYISATPTENTVNFYLGRGCQLALPPDPELLAEEPEDIHLVRAV